MTEDQPMTLSRRGLLGGILLAACAPAIVRASSLMAVKPLRPAPFDADKSQYGELAANISANNLLLLRLCGSSPDLMLVDRRVEALLRHELAA